jgi:opacity protein-like surface antigen
VHAHPLRLVTALAVVAVAATPLAAQSSSRPTFGIAGGLALPTGDLGDANKSGYDIGAFVGFHPATSPVGFRVEGAYDRFDFKNFSNAHTSIFNVTGNIVVGTTAAPGSVRPYLIGGLGVYNVKAEATATTGGTRFSESRSATKFGLNGGAGLDLPLSGIAVFLEARLHYVFSDNGTNGLGYNAGFVPITVGVRF